MRSPHRVLTDDRAVSPAIGVVLLVAIAVATAVAVGALVLGFDAVNDRPQATFDFAFKEPPAVPTTDEVFITHTGGDEMDSMRVFVRGTVRIKHGGGGLSLSNSHSWNALEGEDPPGDPDGRTPNQQDGTVQQGDEVEVETSDTGELNGETIRIIWVAPGGGNGVILASYTVPS